MLILAPSLLAADFKDLAGQIGAVERAGAGYLHLDVMDGAFVPSISFGMPVLSSIRSCTDLVFDVHMMVEEPGRYIDDIKKAGADLICVHQEACLHLDRTVNQIREAGLKAAVALNPATPVSTLENILPELDMVLIMSVNPGFGGQKFIPYTLDKVRALRAEANRRGLNLDIQMDGGITPENVGELIEAGANVFVAGSAVFKGDAAANTRRFLEVFERYEAAGTAGAQAGHAAETGTAGSRGECAAEAGTAGAQAGGRP